MERLPRGRQSSSGRGRLRNADWPDLHGASESADRVMPTPKPPRRKRKPPTRTYELDKYLTGDLEGYHVVMGSMSGREMIRVRSGEFTEGEAIDFAASKVIEHDFDVSDIRDIDGQD